MRRVCAFWGAGAMNDPRQVAMRILGTIDWQTEVSDSLSKDDVGAVFAYLRRRLHYQPHCIIDTAGKSLPGWFDAPRNKLLAGRLKAGLEVFGCDPKMFTYSQPVRVPGAWREGKLQRLVWLRA